MSYKYTTRTRTHARTHTHTQNQTIENKGSGELSCLLVMRPRAKVACAGRLQARSADLTDRETGAGFVCKVAARGMGWLKKMEIERCIRQRVILAI